MLLNFSNTLKIMFLGSLSLHLKPPYSITQDKLRLATWDTSF